MGFFLGLIVGLAVGAAVTAFVLRRPAPAAEPVTAVSSPPPPASAAAVAGDAPSSDGEAVSEAEDLKPVLDATRGVLSELEQRYQGAKATEKTKPPRRRA